MSRSTWVLSSGRQDGRFLSVSDLSSFPVCVLFFSTAPGPIVIAALILIFADLALALPDNNNICWRIVKTLWLDGMTYDENTAQADPYAQYGQQGPQPTPKPIPFFLGALAFFKVFLTIGFLSQSFYGLDNGENEWGETRGPDTQLFCLWAGKCVFGTVKAIY
jgi:hypothetical protein